MRLIGRSGAFLISAILGVLFGVQPAAAVDPLNPSAPCSVFDAAPCTPSFCGVFGPWPCVPSLPSLGQDLRLNIASRSSIGARAPETPVDSIQQLFAALRACWDPPQLGEAYRGLQMTVRFSFKRSGELMGPPRVTYTSKVDAEGRRIYSESIDAMFERCTPIPFTPGMAGAIIGRPINVRFIYDRLDDSDSGGPRYQ